MNDYVKAGGFIIFKKVDKQPLFLIIQSSRDGFWGFPKGHLEENDDELSAALRELEEETGIKEIKQMPGFAKTIKYDVSGRLKTVTYFLAETDEKTIVKLSSEHSSYRWLKAEEADKFIIFNNLKKAFNKAVRFLEAVN